MSMEGNDNELRFPEQWDESRILGKLALAQIKLSNTTRDIFAEALRDVLSTESDRKMKHPEWALTERAILDVKHSNPEAYIELENILIANPNLKLVSPKFLKTLKG